MAGRNELSARSFKVNASGVFNTLASHIIGADMEFYGTRVAVRDNLTLCAMQDRLNDFAQAFFKGFAAGRPERERPIFLMAARLFLASDALIVLIKDVVDRHDKFISQHQTKVTPKQKGPASMPGLSSLLGVS